MNNLTPIEKSTGIEIKSPNDVIFDYHLTSLLIYCYKNDKDLIEWASLIPYDIFRKYCREDNGDLDPKLSSDFDQKSNEFQDLILCGMFIELMKLRDWAPPVESDTINDNFNGLVLVFFCAKATNLRMARGFPGIDKLLLEVSLKVGGNKYDIDDYLVRMNPNIEFTLKK